MLATLAGDLFLAEDEALTTSDSNALNNSVRWPTSPPEIALMVLDKGIASRRELLSAGSPVAQLLQDLPLRLCEARLPAVLLPAVLLLVLAVLAALLGTDLPAPPPER